MKPSTPLTLPKPTASDFGNLETFVRKGISYWCGPEASKARLMAHNYLEYSAILPKESEEAVNRHNRQIFAKLRKELAKPKPCQKAIRTLTYDLKDKPCPKTQLCVTPAGLSALTTLSMNPPAKPKDCK